MKELGEHEQGPPEPLSPGTGRQPPPPPAGGTAGPECCCLCFRTGLGVAGRRHLQGHRGSDRAPVGGVTPQARNIHAFNGHVQSAAPGPAVSLTLGTRH